MKTAFAIFAAAPTLTLVTVAAQDPIKSLPDSYQVQFDNAHARIVRVHYAAGAKLPDHTHPAGTTIYVYLNDSDGVVFRHSSGSSRAVTRPPVKAGAMRIASGPEEHHTAENNAASATDFLRIQLKGAGASRAVRRLPPSESTFEDARIRITRIALEQHDEQTITAKEPALLIEWPSGQEHWLDPGASLPIANHDAATANFIRIDFKM